MGQNRPISFLLLLSFSSSFLLSFFLSPFLPLLTAQARGSAAAPPSVGLVRRWRVLQAATTAGSSGGEGEAKPGRHGLVATRRLARVCASARCTHGVATTTCKLGQGNGGMHKQADGELGWAEGRRFAQAGRVRDAPCACKADGGKRLRCPAGKGEGQAEQTLRAAGRILPGEARPELGKVKAKQSRAAAQQACTRSPGVPGSRWHGGDTVRVRVPRCVRKVRVRRPGSCSRAGSQRSEAAHGHAVCETPVPRARTTTQRRQDLGNGKARLWLGTGTRSRASS